MRRFLLLFWLWAPASAQAQLISPAPKPDPFTSAPTDVAGTLALFRGLAPIAYKVVRVSPHDPQAFTEGLLLHQGSLYESTGLEGRSEVRKVDRGTGDVRRSVSAPDGVFAEGMTLVGDRLILLTYKEGRAFVYDAATFELVGEHRYSGEGWGLAFDGESLIMSDGSSTLTFRDPETFQPRRRVQVNVDGKPLAALNELEFIGGQVWANVWLTDLLVRIDPASGRVTGYLDLAGIQGPGARMSDINDVLNGIAYDPGTGHLLVTGKRWPSVFELELER